MVLEALSQLLLFVYIPSTSHLQLLKLMACSLTFKKNKKNKHNDNQKILKQVENVAASYGRKRLSRSGEQRQVRHLHVLALRSSLYSLFV